MRKGKGSQSAESGVGADAETSAQKMLRLLQCFSIFDRSLSVSQIAERTGMPRSTAHRWCLSLRQVGFLDQDQARDEYRLGLGLFQLGNIVLSSMDLHRQARPVVESLTRAAQDGVHLCVFDGMQMVFVSHSQGGRSGRNNSTTVVEGSPCYCTSVGKAALAFQPDNVVQRAIDQGLQGYTRNTITDPTRLRDELRLTRERGYSVDNGEMEPHVRCVGAPVRNASGQVIAAISVTSTFKRLTDERIRKIAPLVINHADALSIQLGYRVPAAQI
jgi:DNA-binding IclR family transcriptional regulator